MKLKDYAIEEIIKRTCEKKIVFFGVGNYYKTFKEKYEEIIDESAVFCALDNDDDKIGKKVKWKKKEIYIESINSISTESAKELLIIITASAAYSIYLQLNDIKKFDETEACYCNFIYFREAEQIENNRVYPSNFRRTEKPLIPQIIHYCWFGKEHIPEKNKQWMKSWRKYCPNYKIIRWDESNYDFSWSNYMSEAYRKRQWAFVSDVARLDIIYKFGGIYLDTDVELIKPLDDLLYQHCYFGIETGGWVATGLGFGAEKGHYIVKRLLKLYERIKFIEDSGEMNTTSCPILQTPCFEEIGYMFDGNSYYTDNISIYPERVFCPKNPNSGKIHIGNYTFSIHHYDSSWNDKCLLNYIQNEAIRREIN